jgi:exportin-2 (importin alpha re-exporter)
LNSGITSQIYSLISSGLASKDLVVQIYSAACLDKYISSLKIPLNENAEPLAITIMHILVSNPKARLTEYIVKALWKVYVFDKSLSEKRGHESIGKLLSFIEEAAKNSVDAKYNHYLFECLAIILRHMDEASVTASEPMFYPVLGMILSQDIQDFIPYAFQILAYLLSFHKGKGVPDSFKAMLPTLLQPLLWETHGKKEV